MSDVQGGGQQPRLNVLRVYLKDASFESPSTPGLFVSAENARAKGNVDLVTAAQEAGPNRYEVVVKATLKTEEENGGRTINIVEVQQAGLFEISGVTQEQLGFALEVNCPTILFPYLRETIDSLLVRGMFPPAGLAIFNFEARYAAEMNRRRQAAGSPAVN